MTILPPSAGVIGWPIAQSKSPLIHRFWLARLGLDGDYGRFPVQPARLGEAIRALPALGLRGVNVTAPHKEAVIPFLDRLDPVAERIGAVNTIRVEEDGMLAGYNTDAAGFLEPLRPLLAERHLFRMARIIGTGGAALAIAHALWSEGFAIVMVGRDPEKTRRLRASVDPAEGPNSFTASLESFAEPLDFAWDDRSGVLDLLVNATSLGMKGFPPLPIDFSHVPPGAHVYDAVYAPLETPLLAEAKLRGHPVIDGLSMLIGQAAQAFELFFGAPPPREHDAELRALLTA
ncbi:shikimate dehydrogenase [Sphingomonas oleivorans]|uniref:Shikimate dehydrogenase (NADP(+)) n=1 Tax=Sphingomonas oleivorans TaxID=1735121 RepID=A0A2T5G2R1_9SPHN|nr:shikimate dehydrogenase [Sphingomonas oleivorans]PTQ13425.1 shikimate dehydrogenase [Sphingomonas oleivorans]